MDKTYLITVTGIDHYYGKKPFEIGRVFKLIKDVDNEHDKEAIMAYLPFIEKIGYVANSTHTVYQGTISAGRLYDKIDDYAYAKVVVVTHSSVIAVVLDKEDVEDPKEDNEESTDAVSTETETKVKKSKKKTPEQNPIGFKVS